MSKIETTITLDSLHRLLDLPEEYKIKKVKSVDNDTRSFDIELEADEIPEDADEGTLVYVSTPEGIKFEELNYEK